MHLLEPSRRLRDLLASYRRLGGVVDHLFVSVSPTEFETEYERHRQAARYSVAALDPAQCLEPGRLQGQLVTSAEFLGESDPETVGDESPGARYLHAFANPPHGMGAEPAELTALREAILDELVGGLHPSLRIYQWSTDWAGYFDLGHEWWGSYLWTLENPAQVGRIAVIAASTTD